jgi:hypothetical protein
MLTLPWRRVRAEIVQRSGQGQGPAARSKRFQPYLETLEERALPALSYSAAVLADGPSGYYRLDETGGPTAADASGNGNTLTYNGPIAYGLSGALLPNDADPSAGFNGSSTFALASNANALNFTGTAFTLEAWIFPTATGMLVNKENQYEVALQTGAGGQNTIQWAVQNTGNGGNWAWVDTGYAPALNQWSYLVLVYNNGVVTTYANGTDLGTSSQATGSGSVLAGGNLFEIGGRDNTASMVWSGRLDEVAAYNKALTTAQITNHYYSAGNGGLAFAAPMLTNTGGSTSYKVVSGDFNGDGNLDLAVSNYNSSQITILLGHGDGSFTMAPGSPFSAGGQPNQLVVGDFNGDGKLDLAAVNWTGSNVSVFLGNGDGTFTAAPGSTYPLGGNGGGIVAGDFNGDGKLDLAASVYPSGNVYMLLGNGDGTFTAAPGSPFVGGAGTYTAAAGDFNGDGKLDFVKSNYANSDVSVLLGNGAGGLTLAPGSPTAFAGGSQTVAVAVADFNSDGKEDLAVCNYGSNTVSILLGNGDGTFTQAAGSPIVTASAPLDIAATDFNGDGKTDLVVANYSGNSGFLTFLMGNGDGTFSNKGNLNFSSLGINSGLSSVTIGDFNGDGAPDVAVGCYPGSSNVAVLLNEAGTRTTLSAPSSSSYGQAVTFTATVAASVAGAPQVQSGNVSFFDGTTLLGTVAVGAGGQAVFTTAALLPGSHSITARYADTTGFFYMSASAAVIETVNQDPTTTALSSSADPALTGQSITFTATVNGTGPTTPTGSVTFYDGSTAIGTASLSGGTATLKLSTLTAGTHTISAVYSGDAFDLTSTSTALSEVVNTPVPPPPPPPPPPPTVGIIAVGAEVGERPVVAVYDAQTFALKYDLLPFGPNFRGGVRVAVGDVNGDGVPDVICAAGRGGLPQVVVFDGATGKIISSFLAFAGSGATHDHDRGKSDDVDWFRGDDDVEWFRGGLYVAAGDVNGDGHADIILGAGRGGSPQVEVIDGKTGAVLHNFIAFGKPHFHGGVRVAAGDVNGDGKADIICAEGPGGDPLVTIYDGATLARLASFYAMPAGFHGGIFVAAGDINGDGRADIITGAGPGGRPEVSVFDGTTHSRLYGFLAFRDSYHGGVRVGTVDPTSSGHSIILTAPATSDGFSDFRAFDSATLAQLADISAFKRSFGGLYIA